MSWSEKCLFLGEKNKIQKCRCFFGIFFVCLAPGPPRQDLTSNWRAHKANCRLHRDENRPVAQRLTSLRFKSGEAACFFQAKQRSEC